MTNLKRNFFVYRTHFGRYIYKGIWKVFCGSNRTPILDLVFQYVLLYQTERILGNDNPNPYLNRKILNRLRYGWKRI